MKIQVWDDQGSLQYESDDKTAMGVAPGHADRVAVVEALIKAGTDLALGKLPPVPDQG